MKCENCGFISSKRFYRCPYCGTVHEGDNNILDKSIDLTSNVSVRLKSIINIILFNLFGLCILFDWYFAFQYGITLAGYILFLGAITIINALGSKRKLFAFLVGIDIWLLFGLLLSWCYLKTPILGPYIQYVPTFAIPGFIIFFSLLSAILLIFPKEVKKIRPLWFGFVLFVHLIVMIVIFVLFLICKYNLYRERIPFAFMALGSDGTTKTLLFKVEEILVFVSFGLSILYFLNYFITLLTRIFHQVKGYYGKQRN